MLADLEEVRKRAPALADGALARSAVAMAREIDDPGNSATSKSMCANALRETMARIRELLPPEREKNGIDELRSRREQRLARKQDPSDPAGARVRGDNRP